MFTLSGCAFLRCSVILEGFMASLETTLSHIRQVVCQVGSGCHSLFRQFSPDVSTNQRQKLEARRIFGFAP
jgi:hypothetical protein